METEGGEAFGDTHYKCLWTTSNQPPRQRKKNKLSELWKEQGKNPQTLNLI